MGWTRASFSDSQPASFTTLEKQALLITTLLLLPLIAYSIYATRNGIAGERIGGIYIMTDSTGYVNEAQHFVMPLLAGLALATRFHWLNLFPVALYVGYRAWFGWSRWTILLFLLMMTLAYCWYHRKKWVPVWSVVAAVPILIVFNLLGQNRDTVKQFFSGQRIVTVETNPGMSREEKLKKHLDTQDFANFDYLAYVVSVIPERTQEYTYGLEYLQLFTEPIPRILWKGKPVGAPVRTINIGAYGNFTGLTVSLCGIGWMDGGWIGLFITMWIVGGALGAAHRWFWNHTENRLGAMFYLTALAMVPQWYRDGGISIFKFLLFTLFPIVLWIATHWWLGQRLVPSFSVTFPRGTSLRAIEPETANESKLLKA
jgi:hypothetical protein